jgi:hypothetical protein
MTTAKTHEAPSLESNFAETGFSRFAFSRRSTKNTPAVDAYDESRPISHPQLDADLRIVFRGTGQQQYVNYVLNHPFPLEH